MHAPVTESRGVAFTVLFAMMLNFFRSGDAVTMTSDSQVFVINHGQSLEMFCKFNTYEFDMFDNPIVWKKFQRDEEHQINIMGNIFEPFLTTKRFEVAFAADVPRFSFPLHITNVTAEDSGNYTCEVRGSKSAVLASVTHFVFVRAPVRQIYLVVEDTPKPTDNDPTKVDRSTPGRVRFVDGQARYVRCVAVGGYPAPSLHLYVNERDLTTSTRLVARLSMHGQPGLKMMVTRTERRAGSNGGLVLTVDDEGSRLRCVATVPGLVSNITETTVDVHYGPIIECDSTKADMNQFNVYLRCLVRAQPSVTSLFWIADVNGTTVSDDDVTSDYWSTVTDRDYEGLVETRLYLGVATRSSFRAYTVVAENAIAITTKLVQLLHRSSGVLSGRRTPHATSSVEGPSVTDRRPRPKRPYPGSRSLNTVASGRNAGGEDRLHGLLSVVVVVDCLRHLAAVLRQIFTHFN